MMRGVVFTGNSTLDLVEFPDPEPGPRDVVLEIKASGMCGSDLKLYRPPAGAAFKALGLVDSGQPVIAGHEPCGVVAAVGKDVDGRIVKVGDRVTLHHYQGCWNCPECRSGWTQMCERTATVYGVTGNGGHAPYMRAAIETVVHLPEELSFPTGAAISCGTGTAYGALLRLGVSARDTIAIFGQGPVGLSATQLAAAMGARVIAIDVSAERANAAKDFGAVHVIDASSEDPVEAIMALTGGKGANKALDTSGSAPGRSAAVRCASKWGSVCFVGEGGEVTLNVSPDIIRKQLTLVGSWTLNSADVPDCIRFIADHGLDVDKLFTDRWTLDQADEAYKAFDKQAAGKGVFVN
jgi:(R,R)-butanediol dehydrogenase / meso-butanediol dehydrogenase / diacetyl reductase